MARRPDRSRGGRGRERRRGASRHGAIQCPPKRRAADGGVHTRRRIVAMIYICCDERRRQALFGHPKLNGIDFLEVVDDQAMPTADRQRTLLVNFVNPLAPNSLNKTRLRIEGGERIRNVAIESTSIGAGAQDHVLTVKVNHPGDFSIYTLRLVKSPTNSQPPDGFDPQLSAIAFSFKFNCPSDFDCRADEVCPPE